MNNETFDKAQFIKDVQDNVKNLYRKTIKELSLIHISEPTRH